MEFLVRLTDKINTQVFCTNPVHKVRVVFDDPTDVAPCPECGSIEFLYRKNLAISKKGHFITYKPDGWSWGTNELLHYGIVKIDCTEAEAAAWCESIRNDEKEAEAEAENYQLLADARRDVLAESIVATTSKATTSREAETVKELVAKSLEFDTQYTSARASEKLARDKAQIDFRPRKHKFDFDTALTKTDADVWKDENVDSKIVAITKTAAIAKLEVANGLTSR